MPAFIMPAFIEPAFKDGIGYTLWKMFKEDGIETLNSIASDLGFKTKTKLSDILHGRLAPSAFRVVRANANGKDWRVVLAERCPKGWARYREEFEARLITGLVAPTRDETAPSALPLTVPEAFDLSRDETMARAATDTIRRFVAKRADDAETLELETKDPIVKGKWAQILSGGQIEDAGVLSHAIGELQVQYYLEDNSSADSKKLKRAKMSLPTMAPAPAG